MLKNQKINVKRHQKHSEEIGELKQKTANKITNKQNRFRSTEKLELNEKSIQISTERCILLRNLQ